MSPPFHLLSNSIQPQPASQTRPKISTEKTPREQARETKENYFWLLWLQLKLIINFNWNQLIKSIKPNSRWVARADADQVCAALNERIHRQHKTYFMMIIIYFTSSRMLSKNCDFVARSINCQRVAAARSVGLTTVAGLLIWKPINILFCPQSSKKTKRRIDDGNEL